MRDFNFAASPDYRIKKTTWNGIRLRVLYKTSNPNALMSWSLKALKRFSNRVGKYPYNHLDVAETPAGVGMESPGMTWVDATLAKSRFAYIVVHEMSHQWFYGAIGNNQATQPFLDEAVGDFLTRDMLGSFRQPSCAKARLDLRVYDYSGRCYNEVVYVQGGLYLRNYRNQVGDNRFWDGHSQLLPDAQVRARQHARLPGSPSMRRLATRASSTLTDSPASTKRPKGESR